METHIQMEVKCEQKQEKQSCILLRLAAVANARLKIPAFQRLSTLNWIKAKKKKRKETAFL